MVYNLKNFSLIIIVYVLNAFALRTSSESVNPFNELMSPSGGVNLYSGDAAFTHPLFTLQGRGGLNTNLILKYSSNVYLNVRCRNDKAPAGWVGLGWRLDFGSIQCNHNGTANFRDDEYYWISPEGVRQEIIWVEESAGVWSYYLKDKPYWKIERKDLDQTLEDAEGWILTSPDGTKYKYGQQDFSRETYATRYVFCWVNTGYIGQGVPYSDEIELYAHHWDLAEIEDVYARVPCPCVKIYFSCDIDKNKKRVARAFRPCSCV
ncbi:MAG: hypothetical protein GF401_00460 [Chitinivibrionales bacterium]|nr:hypothetical protein [Chitinivibrionales bacterium]